LYGFQLQVFRVAFLIRAFAAPAINGWLEAGGAERQMAEVAGGLSRERFLSSVYTFYPGGEQITRLRRAGVAVYTIPKMGRYDYVLFSVRLALALRAARIDVIYSFLPEANVIAATAGRLAGIKVVWGVRSTNMALAPHGPVQRAIWTLERALSNVPELIIYNSASGRAFRP
jgi:hypothetical protein